VSNTLAIAAVTATLRNMLAGVASPLPGDPSVDSDLADAFCSSRPPDKARTSEDINQLNLFLFQTVPNAALRNSVIPSQVMGGESGFAPLAINLHYLLTAYGRNFDELLAHRLLGRAMSILHDHSCLFPSDIKLALTGTLSGADLAYQIEHVRITPRSLSTEEVSKLWTIFQTPYRVSAAYEVSVVLIDSQQRTTAAPPVIKRGPDDRGNAAVPNLIPPFPALDDIVLPTADQPAARLAYTDPSNPANDKAADPVTFVGHDLGGTQLAVQLEHRLFDAPLPTLPGWLSTVSNKGFTLTLPDSPGLFPAGIYQVSATVTDAGGATRQTNVVPLPIAPRIVGVQPSSPITPAADGSVTLTVNMSPPVWTAQRASMLVGSTEFLADAHPSPTADQLTFRITQPKGQYWLRLRVDGVDSFIIDYTATPIAYDQNDTNIRMTIGP
jgi:hypothetical protein